MSKDYSKIKMSSSASSNKVWKEDTGTFTVPSLSGSGEVHGVAAIPHGYVSDNLLVQVSCSGGVEDGTILPWAPGDNSLILYTELDDENLYINGISSDSSDEGKPAYTINYSYKLLIP